MSAISKDCFKPGFKCYNCERKRRDGITAKSKSKQKQELKRCSGCHLLTYCDTDCQAEHWQRVHKKHCKYLAGRKQVAKSHHNPASCTLCVEERKVDIPELFSSHSPATFCHIQLVTDTMKKQLSSLFLFHEEGKICNNCSNKFACELPFPLGESTGQYLGKYPGLDMMLAHALKIGQAMMMKDGMSGERLKLWKNLLLWRSILWHNFILCGQLTSEGLKINQEEIDKSLEDLEISYGSTNAWWKALKFSVCFIEKARTALNYGRSDLFTLTDGRFKTFKLMQEYYWSQLSKQAMVSESNGWAKFMLWPTLVNGSLTILLSKDTRCQTCSKQLTGQVEISIEKDRSLLEKDLSLPFLMANIGENGTLLACCPPATSPSCLGECQRKDVRLCLNVNEEMWKNFKEERKTINNEGRECDFCLKMSLTSHRCSACLAAQYCSTQCQGKDLSFHKTVCSSWAKNKARKIVGKMKQRKVFETKFKSFNQ